MTGKYFWYYNQLIISISKQASIFEIVDKVDIMWRNHCLSYLYRIIHLNSDISVEKSKSITMERLVVILILHILQFHFIDGENDEKVKRLLLNDPDVVGQISRMQNNINSLTQLVSQLTSKLNTVESELAAQKLKNTGKATCITHLDNTRFSTIEKHTTIHHL